MPRPAAHIQTGLGAIRVDSLERDDIARWLDGQAAAGEMSRRSIQIFRMVPRAALADAVDSGDLRRSPAARVGKPHKVVKPDRARETDAWDDDELQRFLAAVAGHRWTGPLQLAALYGLQRSEVLGLHWTSVDIKK